MISRAPIWRDPSPESKRREARAGFGKCPHGKVVDEDGSGEEDEAEGKEEVKQALKNKISRHREDVSLLGSLEGLWVGTDDVFRSGRLRRRLRCTGKSPPLVSRKHERYGRLKHMSPQEHWLSFYAGCGGNQRAGGAAEGVEACRDAEGGGEEGWQVSTGGEVRRRGEALCEMLVESMRGASSGTWLTCIYRTATARHSATEDEMP